MYIMIVANKIPVIFATRSRGSVSRLGFSDCIPSVISASETPDIKSII
jgi:hypothetical protein